MSAAGTSAARRIAGPRDPLEAPHVHVWELRAVEFDTWGQVSFFECLGCAGVRYA